MKPLNVLEIPLQGRRLIEASAGTGKTYTITTLFLRLLLERHLRIDQIGIARNLLITIVHVVDAGDAMLCSQQQPLFEQPALFSRGQLGNESANGLVGRKFTQFAAGQSTFEIHNNDIAGR